MHCITYTNNFLRTADEVFHTEQIWIKYYNGILDNKQMGKMPAFSLIYCTEPLNASTRLDYTLFWVNILKDLCYVIFRKVYTYMAWTEICYICWLFLPSYIIFFFSNFFLFSLSQSVFDFLHSSRMFFHLCK